jgi:hypothetical protein
VNENGREITDIDREEILRLVLSEAGGADVSEDLKRYPQVARSKFRQVVCEAGLVSAKLVTGSEGEIGFGEPKKLTERGRKRLNDLNTRRNRTA